MEGLLDNKLQGLALSLWNCPQHSPLPRCCEVSMLAHRKLPKTLPTSVVPRASLTRMTYTSAKALPPGRHAGASPEPEPGAVCAPANALSPAEREQVLAALNSTEFVDTTPMQIYAALLDQGIYLSMVSTMYRILGATPRLRIGGVKPATPPGPAPSWSPPPPGRCSPGTSPSWPARSRAATTTPT